MLTSYLNQNYDITSIEPGGFNGFHNVLRTKILTNSNLNVHTVKLEDFKTDNKYDFIFSMNVLEHTDDIKLHIENCVKLLKDEKSLLFIQCPNYSFPFEPHFYEFFIPFMPHYTFQKIKRRRLIKKFGEKRYNNILQNINFNCTYKTVKKVNLEISFINPLYEIFQRIEEDAQFKKRILKNFFIKLSYNFIKFFKIESLLSKFFPLSICPYLIFTIKK